MSGKVEMEEERERGREREAFDFHNIITAPKKSFLLKFVEVKWQCRFI